MKKMSDLIKKLGCIDDPKDNRDLVMRNFIPFAIVPPKLSYRAQMLPIRNQKNEGVCVGFASAAMKEYQDSKERGRNIILSPRFIYHICKERDGIPNQEGTYIRVAMKVLCEKGDCEENLLPYIPHQKISLNDKHYKNAENYKGLAYAKLLSIQDMKQSLYTNGPFVAGVQVFETWMKNKGEIIKGGIKQYGGHAITITGYDEKEKYFEFKNSWGNWANLGYGKLSYDYINNYCMSAWALTDVIEVIREAKKLKRIQCGF